MVMEIDVRLDTHYWYGNLHDRRWVLLSPEIVYLSLKKFDRNGDWQPWTTYRDRGGRRSGL